MNIQTVRNIFITQFTLIYLIAYFFFEDYLYPVIFETLFIIFINKHVRDHHIMKNDNIRIVLIAIICFIEKIKMICILSYIITNEFMDDYVDIYSLLFNKTLWFFLSLNLFSFSISIFSFLAYNK